MKTPPPSRELEAVLIVRESSETVLKRIAGLRSILNYRLEPKPVKMIRDTYFDTPDGSLQKKRTNLRIREINGTLFISVKSSSRTTQSGGIQRKETELPWSSNTIQTITRKLKLKPSPRRAISESTEARPAESLFEMGLQIIQERQTRREARDITSGFEMTGLALAELAIDQVTYHFQDQQVSLLEIEVEAKAESSVSVIRDVTEDLLSMFGPALRRWMHGKFVTGKAIEMLLQAGTLQPYFEDSSLKPEAFDAIDNLIRSK